MNEGLEGLGTAVTGGLLARAVEPNAGQHHEHGSICLNCGAALAGEYCGRCGQQAHVHRSLSAFWHDLLHGVLHFEGKIWRTLPMLAWHPGELTRRYIAGERARFVSPLALFLFSVFLMFASMSAFGGPVDGAHPGELRNTKAEIGSILRAERSHLDELRKLRAVALQKGNAEGARKIEAKITGTQKTIDGLAAVQTSETLDSAPRWYSNLGWKRLDKGLQKINENPSLAFYKVQNNAYKFSWLLIPLSVPFMWLLFPFRRGTSMYDHTVFVTYSIAFMTLLVVAISVAQAVGVPERMLGWPLLLIPPVHMYRQLKGAYRIRWWSAAGRTVLLLLISVFVAALFVALLFLLGAIG